MKKLFQPLLMLALLHSAACSEASELPETDQPVTPPTENPQPPKPETPALNIGSYIRPAFFEMGQVDAESLNSCHDLIFFTAEPNADGTLHFETPDASATVHGATHQAQLNGREGVITLNGHGHLQVADPLLQKAPRKGTPGHLPAFTFGTWIQLNKWTSAHLFRKEVGAGKAVGLKLGNTPGQLVFYIGSQQVSCQAPQLTTGTWHHLCLTHQANQKTAFYIDGQLVHEHSSAAGSLPYACQPVYLAEGLNGALDETFFNSVALPAKELKNIQEHGLNFKLWSHTKTLAYWNYDQADHLGHDSHSWLTILQQVRGVLNAHPRTFRLGIHHGYWQQTCQAANRQRFVDEVYKLMQKHHFDGVDLDFEWPNTAEEFALYSATIVALKAKLGQRYQLSVSLHPTAYKLLPEAIEAADWISLQCYGPRPARFPYEVYVKDLQAALDYGIPAQKLVAGVPFYATLGQGAAGTLAYRTLVEAQALTDRSADQATYQGKTYTLNSQATLQKKVHHAQTLKLKGVMSWDLATDCAYSHPWSLQRAVVEAANPKK